MAKCIVAGLVSILLLGVVPHASAKEEKRASEQMTAKIGYVDLNRALNEVEEGKKAKTKLEADGEAKKKQLEKKQLELRNLKSEFDKQQLILSDQARREKEIALQQGLVELQRMTLEFERDFAQKEAELTKPIGEKLKQIILEMGNTGSYTAILPKEMVLYAPSGTDLTDEVITKYNKLK